MSGYLPNDRAVWDARCPQLRFTVAGRWWRIFAGVTFKTKRVRWQRFDGYRLLVVRLWGWRVVGIQTRAARGGDS
jgi:hypothetical protein